MSGSPFLLVPWHEDFLSALAFRAAQDSGGRLERTAFIFPHARPMRYLSLALRDKARLSKALLMPRMYSLADLFAALAARSRRHPARQAGQLDRVALLLRCARAEAARSAPSFALDAPSFFPWGLKLDALFEECFNQCREPGNFLHVEGSVSPYAAMLLERLGAIFTCYERALAEKGWSSPGHDAFLAARGLDEFGGLPAGLLPDPGPGRAVYIAGFHLLTGAEEKVFKAAWQQGATVILHADPALAGAGGRPHWSCEALARWAAEWGTRIELMPGARAGSPEVRPVFVAAYDLHSQLATLGELLKDKGLERSGADGSQGEANAEGQGAAQGQTEAHLQDGADRQADTALILPSGELLLPTLHHLPDKNVNISMGYPLARSPLFRLVDALGRLQEGRRGQAYYWRDLVDFLRHPYIKMLGPGTALAGGQGPDTVEPGGAEPGEAGSGPERGPARSGPALDLRRALRELEKALRDSKRSYADPFALLAELRGNESGVTNEAWTAAAFLCRVCLSDFEEARSLADLALALERLCVLMIDSGAALWERFPIDAECLYRLRQHVIPELAAADFGAEHFPARRLYAMLRDLLRSQRVPFEAEPLVGMQVLGMLESRLLSFKRVIVLDATEENLPGSASGDPLLPEALRPELGLPPLSGREQAVAHNFFRLLHSAAECLVLWRDSGEAPGIQEPKSGRSRFVQELLWEEEKTRGRLFARQGRDGPLTVLAAAITPMPVADKPVRIKGPVRELLDDLARRPLSASLLDAYLQCPVRFFYERLLKLAEADEIREGDDPLAVGALLHKSLERVYSARLEQGLPGGAELAGALGDELRGVFFQLPEYADLEQRLPADHLAMLREAGRQRLGDYLLKQPPTTVLAVEWPLQARFKANGHDFCLAGQADRIDRRPLPQVQDREGLFILDYKSGRAPETRPALWLDDAFWRSLRAARPCAGPSDGRDLHELLSFLPGVQLPLYALICSLDPKANKLPALPVGNAMWVALGAGGDEKPLLPEELSTEDLEIIAAERLPELIGTVLRHLFESDFFFPRRGGHCNWCSRQKSCIADS